MPALDRYHNIVKVTIHLLVVDMEKEEIMLWIK
jgi:hypothetical protein